jgi:hypothetical protein
MRPFSGGDGTRTAGTVAANSTGGFNVTGTHTYATGGVYTIFVKLLDGDGNAGLALSSATVADTSTPGALNPVATSLVQSGEGWSDQIIQDYQRFLGRTPAASEVAGWVNAIQHGMSDAQVLAGFLGSPEFYVHTGSNSTAWLNVVYQDLLERGADQAGENSWLQALASGAARGAVAMAFATSQEYDALVARKDYQRYLGRTAGAGEIAGWVNALERGATNEQVAAAFLSSQEYYTKQNANAHNWLFSAYQQVLSRSPDQAGYASWMGALGENFPYD